MLNDEGRAVRAVSETMPAGLSRRQLMAAAASLAAASMATQAEGRAGAGYDVILLAGQSNMVGYGTGPDNPHDAAVSKRVWQWDANNGVIIPAADPLVQNQGPGFVGLGLTFGKSYARTLAPGRKVLLVGAATGGTGFYNGYWQAPNGVLAVDALQRANAAMAAAGPNARFAGILWHQGEADILNLNAQPYFSELSALIAFFRANITGAASATPFVVGEMTYQFLASYIGDPKVGPAQTIILNDLHTLPDQVPNAAWVSSVALPGDSDQWGTIHFSALSQRQLGRRYADKFFEAANSLPQPETCMVSWGGGFYDSGRSYQNGQGPINLVANVIGTVTAARDMKLGNVAVIRAGAGCLGYFLPATTFNGSYTKMAWFWPSEGGHQNTLVAGDNGGQVHFLSAMRVKKGLLIEAGHAAGPHNVTNIAHISAAPPRVWVNIAMTYDATAQTMSLFVNGARVAQQGGIAPAPPITGIAAIIMGSADLTPATGVDGRMGRNRAWSSALTAGQIVAIVDYESAGIEGF